MIIQRDIGEKGQVVIPRDIRQFLDLRTGGKVIFEITGESVCLKQEQNSEEFLEDFFDVPKLRKKPQSKDIKKIILEQYEDEIC